MRLLTHQSPFLASSDPGLVYSYRYSSQRMYLGGSSPLKGLVAIRSVTPGSFTRSLATKW